MAKSKNEFDKRKIKNQGPVVITIAVLTILIVATYVAYLRFADENTKEKYFYFNKNTNEIVSLTTPIDDKGYILFHQCPSDSIGRAAKECNAVITGDKILLGWGEPWTEPLNGPEISFKITPEVLSKILQKSEDTIKSNYNVNLKEDIKIYKIVTNIQTSSSGPMCNSLTENVYYRENQKYCIYFSAIYSFNFSNYVNVKVDERYEDETWKNTLGKWLVINFDSNGSIINTYGVVNCNENPELCPPYAIDDYTEVIEIVSKKYSIKEDYRVDIRYNGKIKSYNWVIEDPLRRFTERTHVPVGFEIWVDPQTGNITDVNIGARSGVT